MRGLHYKCHHSLFQYSLVTFLNFRKDQNVQSVLRRNTVDGFIAFENGEECACVLLERVSVSQSTLSHHMKILVDSGAVSARKEGKWTYYSI